MRAEAGKCTQACAFITNNNSCLIHSRLCLNRGTGIASILAGQEARRGHLQRRCKLLPALPPLSTEVGKLGRWSTFSSSLWTLTGSLHNVNKMLTFSCVSIILIIASNCWVILRDLITIWVWFIVLARSQWRSAAEMPFSIGTTYKEAFTTSTANLIFPSEEYQRYSSRTFPN